MAGIMAVAAVVALVGLQRGLQEEPGETGTDAAMETRRDPEVSGEGYDVSAVAETRWRPQSSHTILTMR